MSMSSTILSTVAGLVLAGSALAQGSAPSEPNLGSAGQFRNITATGVTKPPSGARDDRDARPPEEARKDRTLDRKITTGICVGCN